MSRRTTPPQTRASGRSRRAPDPGIARHATGTTMIDLQPHLGTPIEGRNGQFYYRGDESRVGPYDHYLAGIRRGALASWTATLARRARELGRRGIRYHVVVVPGAHVACPEDLPDDLRGRIRAPFPRLQAALAGTDGLRLHYALADLVSRDPSPPGPGRDGAPHRTYRRNDTHWTEYGAYRNYLTVCRAIARELDVRVVEPADVTFATKQAFGDLSILRLPEGRPETIPLAVIRGGHRAHTVSKNTTVVRNRVIRMRSDTAPATAALIFHDSYATAQAKFWARSFGRTTFAGVTHRVYLDAVARERPDVVISIMAEHRLFEWPNDHDPWTFADDFESDCRSPAGRRTADVMVLYRQQKIAAAADAAAGIGAEPGFGAYHARVAAQALIGAHRVDDALAMAMTALSLDRESPSNLWMAAYASLYAGKPEDALTLATWAAGSDPHHGAWTELLASILIGLGRREEAALVLERAVAAVDDSPGLWRLLAETREAGGRPGPARQARAMVDALTGEETGPGRALDA
ncbi:alginate O-acetyltransferase AlgX-related protein [Methylobacterium platani]|uniref:alginate O-acetyltransferase AlgX-related protein n=1 Tax=Methylobacterium platani TaxID=427683 RepID=UPI0018D489B2|nr:tetratricopeptide repeat protein [Methylobacterium platani]